MQAVGDDRASKFVELPVNLSGPVLVRDEMLVYSLADHQNTSVRVASGLCALFASAVHQDAFLRRNFDEIILEEMCEDNCPELWRKLNDFCGSHDSDLEQDPEIVMWERETARVRDLVEENLRRSLESA